MQKKISRYNKSEILLKKALKIIPLGTQTYSKSLMQFPYGISPYFIEKGKGSHVWDIDGNEYIDFINALCAVNLGYQDSDVDNAVKAQMEKGVIFSLASPLEVELSSKIIEMVPCAEMVRFGKNGSDVTTAAIRLARAYTQKEHIIFCGYHGWQDWYMGAYSECLGIPESTRQLTHSFVYNDIQSLDKIFKEYPDQIAAVIMEPMTIEFPKNNFLKEVKELTHCNKALFILDEIITGFRFSEGGAQELFGVTPDLACFGKGIANGYPLSALVGKRDIMQLVDKISFTLTHGGETLSIAAGLATLKKIQKSNVTESIIKKGEILIKEVNTLIYQHKLSNILDVKGHPSWSFLIFNNIKGHTSQDLMTFFMGEVLKRGVLFFGDHVLSYSHSEKDIQYLLSVYDEVFPLIKKRTDSPVDLSSYKPKLPRTFPTRRRLFKTL